MVILKKIKASTLMETLVATVLIVIVFVVSSLIMNNLFLNKIKNNTQEIDAYLNELEYLYQHQKIALPYVTELGDWEIIFESYVEKNINMIEIEAINTETNKTITKQKIDTK